MASDSDVPIASLRASTWTPSVVLAGLALLVMWRSIVFIDRQMLLAMPRWLLFLLTVFLPEVFLLLLPLLTRQQVPPGRFCFLPPRQLLKESVIAIFVVIASAITLAGMKYTVQHFWPVAPLESKSVDAIRRSSGSAFVYAYLLSSVTYGPVAEEVFFRGFLFNVFCRRMPLWVAGSLASLIFGLCHFAGPVDAIVATLIGLVLNVVYWWRQTIATPILVHLGYNTLAAAGLLLAIEAHRDAAYIGVNSDRGTDSCLITTVTPNSPADLAGIRVGDTLVRFDTHAVQNFQQLLDTIRQYQPGDSISVTVIRGEDSIDFDVILSSRRAMSSK